MTTHRFFAMALSLVLFGTCAIAVRAQDAPSTHGSVKVRPRYFNPFVVGTSRLTLNPFGIFEVAEANLNSSSPTSASSAEAIATTSTTTTATSSALSDPSGSGGGSLGVGTSVLRPPYRPPTRSPFRPPPRPPFSPP